MLWFKRLLAPKDQKWFWTKDVQKDFKESEDDIKNGRYREYKSIEDFAKSLQKDMKE